MHEYAFFVELIKTIGSPALVFIMFYIYHKTQTEMLLCIIKNLENREKTFSEYLQQQIETMQCMASQLSRIEYKIDTYTNCPIIKQMKEL